MYLAIILKLIAIILKLTHLQWGSNCIPHPPSPPTNQHLLTMQRSIFSSALKI